MKKLKETLGYREQCDDHLSMSDPAAAAEIEPAFLRQLGG